MTLFVNIDEVYLIHEAILRQAKTTGSVRDFSLLHSAVERPKATYGGKDLYPTLFFKAAALLQSLCMNHPFTDGNKRTAWESTKRLLWINGYHLKTRTKEGADFMVMVDNQKPDLKQIAAWLQSHCIKQKGSSSR
ncbi:MAG: type II toxin-antitoxin system death-on-curing family toxin [bacterium]|nr:type II toxin-antitoxin system death-on-curing family toxin [bacterium]